MEKDEFIVGGYHFNSLTDARLAEEEIKKAEYFEERAAGRSTQNLLAVYDKILDEKIFKTPVGWEYLKKMQEELRLSGVPEENIRAIPMYSSFNYRTGDEIDAYSVKQRIKPAKPKKEINKFQVSVIINILLLLLVLAMFLVALQSKNPNILNYKQAITNQYAEWEQELTEREKVIREKERELFIEAEENKETEEQ